MMKAANIKKLDWDTQVKTVKRIARLIRPYWFLVVLSLVSAAVSVVGQLSIPILTGQGIDYMLGPGRVDFAGVEAILGNIILVAVLSGLGQWLLGVGIAATFLIPVATSFRQTSLQK